MRQRGKWPCWRPPRTARPTPRATDRAAAESLVHVRLLKQAVLGESLVKLPGRTESFEQISGRRVTRAASRNFSIIASSVMRKSASRSSCACNR